MQIIKIMKKNIIIGLWLLCVQIGLAQRHEVGAKIGLNSLVGDIGSSQLLPTFPNDLTKTPIHLGVSYKRNFNPYQGVKLSLGYHQLHFNDENAQEIYRQQRKSYGENEVFEAALTFEYNFYPINNELRQPMWSPYIFGGVSGLAMSVPTYHFVVTRSGSNYLITPTSIKNQRRFTAGIPFGIGLKYKMNTNWSIYGEATFRPTFSDDLDFNDIEKLPYSVEYQNINATDIPAATQVFENYINANKIGNLNSKDWLNSITIGISYSFGRPPCYCD